MGVFLGLSTLPSAKYYSGLVGSQERTKDQHLGGALSSAYPPG